MSDTDQATTTSTAKPKRRKVKALSAPEFAAKHGFNQRRVRRVLRDMGQGVGTGERYKLTGAQQKALLKRLRKNEG